MDECLIEMFKALIQMKVAVDEYIKRWSLYYPNLTREYLDEQEFALVEALNRFQNWPSLIGESK